MRGATIGQLEWNLNAWLREARNEVIEIFNWSVCLISKNEYERLKEVDFQYNELLKKHQKTSKKH